MNEQAQTLYLIACAAGPAHEAHVLAGMATSSGWDVFVGTTPDGAGFVDAREVLRFTGHPVRSDYRPPDGLDGWPLAEAIVVAPATLNTVNKLAAGIADSFVLSVLCECMGLDVPLIVAPNVNPALARHPRFQSSVRALGEWGAHVLYEPSAAPPIWMVSWEEILGALDSVRERLEGASPGNPRHSR
jgi:flavoprotein